MSSHADGSETAVQVAGDEIDGRPTLVGDHIASDTMRVHLREQGPVVRPRTGLPVPSASITSPDAPFRRWVHCAIVLDLIAATIAAMTASWARFGTSAGNEPVSIPYTYLGVLVVLTWPLLLASAGAYELRTQLFGVEELRRVLRTGVTLL